MLKVFNGEPLKAHDKFSFECPPIECSEDWDKLLSKSFEDPENFATHIEQFPKSRLREIFEEENLAITIEIFMESLNIRIII